MIDTVEIASIALTIPDDCPDKVRFVAILRKSLETHFPDGGNAVECRMAWRQVQLVPPPFDANPDAACHYTRAALALSRPAQHWEAFEAAVNREVADFEDDGGRKEPAIPGWSPDWISFG